MGSKGHEVKRIWGQANPCPECGSAGFLDRIDLVDRVTYEHCTECGNKYVEKETEIALLYRQ